MSEVDAHVKVADSAQTKRGFSRWQKLMLLGMVAVNLCLFGAMFLISREGGTAPSEPELTVAEPLEFQTAYQQALALASGWQPDVQLVGATTSWQLASGDRLTLHRQAWSFSFYSPVTRRIQMVTVDRNGARAGRQQSVSVAPRTVEPDWQLDSDDLLLTFLGYGGADFIGAHPSANVHLQLKGEGTGRSIWFITAVDPATRQTLVVPVDAHSRTVVLSE
jgi:hypothetical protein